MRKLFFALFAFLLFLKGFGQSDSRALLGNNVLLNSGFENKNDHWNLSKNAKIDTSIGFRSTSSLVVENMDPDGKFSGTSQRLEIAPGSTIYFKTKVKGERLASKSEKPDSDGARIYIQAYDEFGKIIGGRYPKLSGLGTFDWKEMSGDFTVPIEAVSVVISVTLFPGVTGKAWFDEVAIQLEKPPLIEAFLLKPHYRGIFIEGKEQVIKERIRVNRSYYDNIATEVQASYELKDVRNKTVDRYEVRVPKDLDEMVVAFPLKNNLREGDYTLYTTYKEQNKVHEFSRRHRIEVLKNWPTVYIDEDGNTVKEGQKIFPFGVYIGHPDDEHLNRISKAGFNTVLSYGYGHNKKHEEYLDRADKYGLNVIYSLKDFYLGRGLKIGNADPTEVAKEYINVLKYKPALLAWYTVDELLPVWIPKIQTLYETILTTDPQHPTLQVHYYDGYRMLEKYYYNGDIIATDPYPVGRSDLRLTSTRVGAGYKATHQTKGHWAVLQMMDWAVYQKEKQPNPPSLDELRNQSYQAIVHGAKGILLYTYYDLFHEKYPRSNTLDYDNFNKLWPDIEKMAKELNSYIPLFLEGKDHIINMVKNDKVEIKCITYEGMYYLITANPFYAEKEITIELPVGCQVADLQQGQLSAQVDGRLLTLKLPPIGSGIFKLAM
ncbi:carbohydrate binding domain-containing protein [Sphingobacterium tabacisoli]|uniref:Glycoside hydrolase family 42 N-terminal domain-containing protein n=1 Tax=Sphingobacterium tabacisoli TaxID=2044855 RepID=A0ABW5L790_9SPHI|nr:hypothetical protein [Sphingobacterium tabacisoli]